MARSYRYFATSEKGRFKLTILRHQPNLHAVYLPCPESRVLQLLVNTHGNKPYPVHLPATARLPSPGEVALHHVLGGTSEILHVRKARLGGFFPQPGGQGEGAERNPGNGGTGELKG